MAPGACGEPSSTSITGVPATIINYHLVTSQKSRHRCVALCLGKNPAQARLKCLDLCCSFEALVKAEYGGRDHLDFAARNYTENARREEIGICGIMYERALRNLVVAMYRHYVDLFRCHSATPGHRIVLAYNCLEVAAKLGRYHRAVRRRQPGEELPDWIPTPEIPARDHRLDYVDALTLLGNTMHPAYGHQKTLAQAYDQVYYEGQEMGNLPLRGRKMAEQSAAVYWAEYAQIVHRFSTLTRIDSKKFVRPMPTSLVHPEMVFPSKKYEAYCLNSMSTHRIRSSWRGQNGLPARSLRRYAPRSTVVIPVTPALTPRWPKPFRQYRSPQTQNRVERSPRHQPGRIHARWNLLPFRV